MPSLPSYTFLSAQQWEEKIGRAFDAARKCRLCPRQCGIDRLAGQTGFCGASDRMRISSIFAHHGEEPCLSGAGGSGTVFFSYCTLKCLFCQNYEISHLHEGEVYSEERLAEHMLGLQKAGCHNINLVTATHYLPWVLQALFRASQNGLRIPVVYNCGGYESGDAIDLLKDIVDIYLPDMKYGNNETAARYCSAADYVEISREAVRLMFRQVGALRIGEDGYARRGLIVRHLVLPDGRAGSDAIRQFLRETFDTEDIAVSVMAQYRPLFRAKEFLEIAREVTPDEYNMAKEAFISDGFAGYYQNIADLNTSFIIDFKKRKYNPLVG